MIYAFLTELAGPYLRRHLRLRAARGKEEATRLAERYGSASVPRPPGKLIWFHAASVGEAVALLALITAIVARYPQLHVLVTTGTVTSAQILAKRLPPGAVHQYVPLDRQSWVKAFLDHWHPDAAIWTESEIWPNLLRGLHARGIPAAVVNGRLSPGSARSWKLAGGLFKNLLQIFRVRLAQSEGDAQRLGSFGVPFRHVGNLKLAVQPAPVDEAAVHVLKQAIGTRPLWLAASTHAGEEAIAIGVHRKLVARFPDLLTIIVPRHTARGDEIAALIAGEGLTYTRRSQGGLPDGQTAIYLADTMGELGTLYDIAPIVFIGGSLTFDGHSPVEAAQRDVAIVYGPQMRNNASIAAALEACGASRRVRDADELETTIAAWLSDPAAATAKAHAAKMIADNGKQVVARIMGELQPIFTAAGL
jgi:3-deoxy-D-manno-octulosonic-acid transferase